MSYRQEYELERSLVILEARESFWCFQKITDPVNFKDERTYLIVLAISLQSFYEDKIISYWSNLPITHHENLGLEDTTIPVEMVQDGTGTLFTADARGADILIVEIPPRHHKSHSLIMFEDWIFGKDTKQILITASYNSNLAHEFSQYVRDGIEEQKMRSTDIVYRDIFPLTRTKRGDRSKQRWSLEGSFLSYTGAGILAGVMGKGGNMIIIDDPIRGALEAFNENHLDKVWTAYTNSWLSRLERPRKQILVMTPWIEGDPADRIIDGAKDSKENVFVLNMKAWTEKQGMLCDEILDLRSFEILKSRLDPIILSGNYLCTRLGLVGKLYTQFNTYTEDERPELFEEIYCYIDTADEGKDFLSGPLVGINSGKDEFGMDIKKAYLLDVIYSDKGMEITEPMTVNFLIENHIQSNMTVDIESNNGGRGFSRAVEKLLKNDHRSRGITINWFSQNVNKLARINNESNTIMKYFYYPADFRTRNKMWNAFATSLIRYSKEGGNKHDDGPDSMSGISERRINRDLTMLDAIGMSKNKAWS